MHNPDIHASTSASTLLVDDPSPGSRQRPFRLIGELINHAFARARKAWESGSVEGYQELARLETTLGADYLTVNIDGTQSLTVTQDEMLARLPDLVPALQEVTSVPLAFDNPSVEYHRVALRHYDPERSGKPILNSVAASRKWLDEWLALIEQYDTLAVVMASERFAKEGSVACQSGQEVYDTARQFVHLLRDRAGRRNDQIIVDPGLAPVAADTYGLVNVGLDAMRLVRDDPDLEGVHLSVGLTNVSFGTPRPIRVALERAYLTLALDAGLDFVLGSPEKVLDPLPQDDPFVLVFRRALQAGRPRVGEARDEGGYRQAETIMELFP